MTLMSQKRLAAELLKVGATRVWVDPEDTDRVSSAITRNEIRKLIHEGSIRKLPELGISRGRKRTRRQELLAGRHKGPGSTKGNVGHTKRKWVIRIRSMFFALFWPSEKSAGSVMSRRPFSSTKKQQCPNLVIFIV